MRGNETRTHKEAHIKQTTDKPHLVCTFHITLLRGRTRMRRRVRRAHIRRRLRVIPRTLPTRRRQPWWRRDGPPRRAMRGRPRSVGRRHHRMRRAPGRAWGTDRHQLVRARMRGAPGMHRRLFWLVVWGGGWLALVRGRVRLRVRRLASVLATSTSTSACTSCRGGGRT